MDRPTLRQLEIFEEVARIGTFRGAARHLGLSQVAISDHIRQLEARLGFPLFIRNAGARPSLSPAGRIVLDHGRNVLFACDALIAAARQAANGEDAAGPSPLLTYSGIDLAADLEESFAGPAILEPHVAEVGEVESAVPAPAAAVVPAGDKEKPIHVLGHPTIVARVQDRLIAAQEAFPDRPIAIDYRAFTQDAVQATFQAGQADIALYYALNPSPALASDYMWSEAWSLYARADHPLAEKDMLLTTDCEDMPVIMLAADNPLRALCERCLAQAGLWPTPTVLETDDYGRIVEELGHGEAVFATFGLNAAQFGARSGLKRLALAEPLAQVQVRRAINPDSADDPVVAALSGLLA